MDRRTDRQTDRQTDGRTDRVITIGLPHLRWRGPNNLRGNADFLHLNYRLLTSNMSFFPFTIRSWDALEFELRHQTQILNIS